MSIGSTMTETISRAAEAVRAAEPVAAADPLRPGVPFPADGAVDERYLRRALAWRLRTPTFVPSRGPSEDHHHKSRE